VFGRDATIDPHHDPVVRLEAAKLRRSLERYYLIAGQADPIRIDIPKGGYVPTFEVREQPIPDQSPRPAADEGAATAAVRLPPGDRRWPWRRLTGAALAIALGAVLAVIGTTAWLWLVRAPADQEGAQAAANLKLEGPAVVVAPFEDLTGTEAGRLLAGGLTQELITDLMRFEGLRVYAASSNERWAEDPAGVGQQLRVGYEVKGSVVRAPDRIRLTVQLIEVGSRRYVWSETFDRPLTTEDVFALQEELAAELAGRLAEPYGIVQKVSADLFHRHRPESLSAYECVLRTFAYRRTFSRELYGPSRACLEDTVRVDPSYPDGWALLAFAHMDEYRWYGLGPSHEQPVALDQALGAAERARELDPDSVTALSAYAAVQFYRGAFDEAESAQRRAVALNPNNPEMLAQRLAPCVCARLGPGHRHGQAGHATEHGRLRLVLHDPRVR
jgi:TolB-like protein